MHRPLRVPFYLRVWHLIKGVLFYNTVYWQKASDGLNMPTLSREERESIRPKANPEIVKPREKPRARLDTFRGAQVSKPDHLPQISDPLSPSSDLTDSRGAAEDLADGETSPHGRYVKRRRYKRRRTSGAMGGNGFFRRVFGK